MRSNKPMIVALALIFVLWGVSSLTARDGRNPRELQRPDAGEVYGDPPPLEGDPWQDDEGGGQFTSNGGPIHLVIGPSMFSPFAGFQVMIIKVLPPTEKTVKKTATAKSYTRKKTK